MKLRTRYLIVTDLLATKFRNETHKSSVKYIRLREKKAQIVYVRKCLRSKNSLG